MATKRTMTTVTRVVGEEENDGEGGKGNGNGKKDVEQGRGKAMKRSIATATRGA
jgi:hypothetical protein